MVLRMELIGVSTYDAAGAAADAAAPAAGFLPSFSLLRYLSKDDCNFPPLDSVSSGTGAELGGGAVPEPVPAGSEDSLASSLGASLGGSFCPPASSSVKESKADASSPSSIMTAMGWKIVSDDNFSGAKQLKMYVANSDILLSGLL